MAKFIKFYFVIVIFLFSGCASFYRNVSPETISYPKVENEQDIDFVYRYDVLREAGNKKFVKNELKRNIRIVAVKLTNNTNKAINFSNDITFYCGGSPILLLTPRLIKTKIQQSWPAYGFYLIGCLTFDPIDCLVFGGIGVGNMIVAANANKNLLNELIKYDLTNKVIESGESVIGIIGFETLHSDPITIKLYER
jgi:hypothetical protein